MKTRPQDPYEQIILGFKDLHRDIRRLENMVVQNINKGGPAVTWDQIAQVIGTTDEGARRHYTKNDGQRRRKKT